MAEKFSGGREATTEWLWERAANRNTIPEEIGRIKEWNANDANRRK